jgi:hypothetical protein
MSWSSCIQKKIVDHYGPQVSQCVSGITKHNFEDVALCICNVMSLDSPAEVMALLTTWSVECTLPETEAST